MKFTLVLLLNITFLYARAYDSVSVKEYYHYKYAAELCILDNNFSSSLENYKTAFSKKRPNARDIYNAFVVAYIEKDSPTAKAFYNNMILHGFSQKKFESLYFTKTIISDSFYKWINRDTDSLFHVYKNGPIPERAIAINKIYQKDQKLRIELNRKDKSTIRHMIHGDSINLQSLKLLVEKDGFPGYNYVGVADTSMAGYIHGASTYWWLLWHTRNISKALNQLSLQFVKMGDFPPDDYALIIDAQSDSSFYFQIFSRSEDNFEIFKPILNEEEVNLRRQKIFLEPITEYRRKLNYEKQTNKIFFLTNLWSSVLNNAPIDFREWNN